MFVNCFKIVIFNLFPISTSNKWQNTEYNSQKTKCHTLLTPSEMLDNLFTFDVKILVIRQISENISFCKKYM